PTLWRQEEGAACASKALEGTENVRLALNSRALSFGAAILVGALFAACGSGGTDEGTATPGGSGKGAATATAPAGLTATIGKDDKADLTGAGATFPAPIYQAWFQDYNKVAGGVKVNYQA